MLARWLSGFILLAATTAEAASITVREIGPGTSAVYIDGVIEAGDGRAFTRSIMTPGKATVRADIVSVIVNSPGGSVTEGELIGAEVKIARLPVYVPPGSICASACFIIAASSPRKALHGAIGIHGAAVDGIETPAAMAATMGVARSLAARGVPSAVIGRMVTTPASDMVWLTRDELQTMPGYVPPAR